MSLLDILNRAEEATPSRSNIGNNGYGIWRLILEDNTPTCISFLTDWAASLPLKLHWNDETKRMDLCDSLYGRDCAECKKKKIGTNGKEQDNYPTRLRLFAVYVHDKVGKKRSSADGEKEYDVDPINLYELRAGEGQENFTTMSEASERGDLVVDSDTGADTIWQVKRLVVTKGRNKKVSYPAPKPIKAKVAQELLGTTASVEVPAQVRAEFEDRDLVAMLPFYLKDYGNVDYEAWGVEPLTPPVKAEPKDEEETVEEIKLKGKSKSNKDL
jgi:hypothetical protein